MDMTTGHATNFFESLADDIAKRTDDLGCTRERAFAEIVLDIMSYPTDEDYRRDHFSDGPGDHGIDFWDVQDKRAVVYQFKTVDLDAAAPSLSGLAPNHLGDLHRIITNLKNLDSIPEAANAGTRRCLESLRSALVRLEQQPKGEDLGYRIELVLASNASSG